MDKSRYVTFSCQNTYIIIFWVKLFKIRKHLDTLLTDVSCRMESTSFKVPPVVTVGSLERTAFQLPVLVLKLSTYQPLNKHFLTKPPIQIWLKIIVHLSNEVLWFTKARYAMEHLKNSERQNLLSNYMTRSVHIKISSTLQDWGSISNRTPYPSCMRGPAALPATPLPPSY